MRKLTALTLLLALSLPLVSCTKVESVACGLEISAVHALAPLLASSLQCANEPQVEADLISAVNKTAFCAQAPAQLVAGAKGAGLIPAPLCSLAVAAAVELLGSGAQAVIPASWQCALTNAGASLSTLLAAACAAI